MSKQKIQNSNIDILNWGNQSNGRLKAFSKVKRLCAILKNEPKYRKIAKQYNFNGFKRIYFYHIRKTAGTSINHMFLASSGHDPKYLYQEITSSLEKRIKVGSYIYTSHNRVALAMGNYFYGYSHRPMHKLRLPKDTYTFTSFRDPVSRVLSLYRMLVEIVKNYPRHELILTEGKWIEGGFASFLQNTPKSVLLNQLYMFSENLEVSDGVDNVSTLNRIIRISHFESDIDLICRDLGISVSPLAVRKTSTIYSPTDSERKVLETILEPEYQFLTEIRAI